MTGSATRPVRDVPSFGQGKRRRILLLSASLLALSLSPRPVSAADSPSSGAPAATSVQEVVVTSERRKKTAQKVAASVSVRSGNELARQGRRSLADVLQDVPGVVVTGDTTTSDTAGTAVTVRGIPTPTNSLVPATAIYVDDVYEGIGGDYDVARVEALRGPQGTLYGRSATGGVVAFHTNNPELGRYGGDAAVEIGSYKLRRLTGAANVPIGDVLALRLAGSEYDRAGIYSARGGSLENTQGRAKLLYQPNDSFSLLLAASFKEVHNHSGGVSIKESAPGRYSFTSSAITPTETHTHQLAATADVDLGFATLTYIGAYHSYQTSNPSVIDGGAVGGVEVYYDSTSSRPLDEVHTEELRLTSDPDSKLSWILGSFYFSQLYKNKTEIDYSDGVLGYLQDNDNATKNFGLFGEATYPLFDDSWRLTEGLRWDYTRTHVQEEVIQNGSTNYVTGLPASFSYGTLPDSQSRYRFFNFTYKVRLEKDLTPRNLIYVANTTGFLPGNTQLVFNSSNEVVPLPFAQEKLTSFEIGSKNRFLDNRLQLNGDVFYYLYSGYQEQLNIEPSNPNPVFAIISTPARMVGTEIEATGLITAADRATLSLAMLEAKFVDIPSAYQQFLPGGREAGVPRYQLNALYEHTVFLSGDGSVVLHGDAKLTSSYDTSQNSDYTLAFGARAYTRTGSTLLGNLALTWNSPTDKYAVTGYVNNVANLRYVTSVSANANATATSLIYGAGFGDPRTFGLQTQVSF